MREASMCFSKSHRSDKRQQVGDRGEKGGKEVGKKLRKEVRMEMGMEVGK